MSALVAPVPNRQPEKGLAEEKDEPRSKTAGDAPTGTGAMVTAEDVAARRPEYDRLVYERLRASEERFRIIANSCPTMMWATDMDGNIQFANRAYGTFGGMPDGEIDRSKWQWPIHPDDAPQYLESFDRAVRERTSFSAEARMKRADGEWRLLGSRAEPSLSSNGDYLGHIGLSADITERILAERARQFELSMIRSIHEGSLDGILVVNSDGIVASFNAKFLDLWKLSSTDAVDQPLAVATGLPIWPILERNAGLAEDTEAYLKRVSDLYEDPEATDHCEIKLKDGRTIERHSASLGNEKGESLGRLWFFREITLRKEQEASLKDAKALADEANRRLLAERSILESERKMLRALIDNIPEFMYVKDTEARFVVANAHLAQVFGLESPDQLLGKTDFDFFPPEMAEAFYEDDRKVIHCAHHFHNLEEKGIDRNGNETLLLTTKVPLRDIHDRVVGIAGVGRDITERNLLREQLTQAQKLESVGQLAAGIAHEINTPVQYIGDNVRFLKDSFHDLRELLASYERLLAAAQTNTLSGEMIDQVVAALEYVDAGYLLAEIPKAIEQTREGVTRVSTLVCAMKEFSHPGTKEKVLLDINHAIESTIAVARNEWKYVATMETDFDPSLPPIPCQPGEFNQVILNLIVNAAHAIADVVGDRGVEKGSIGVVTRNYPEWAEIRIQDSGTGIPEGARNRIFDPFFTTKEIGKGTGQGLAIARSVVVDKHGGTIHFETETGKGTTFVIRLPHESKSPEAKVAVA